MAHWQLSQHQFRNVHVHLITTKFTRKSAVSNGKDRNGEKATGDTKSEDVTMTPKAFG